MINFYELLGIKKEATELEIKIAYKNMVKKYHPDINKSAEANQITISLNEAKEVLLNKDKRREYDLLLDEIEHSKQVSKNKNETYTSKTQEYKEKYSESYVTRWQFLVNYFKNGLDKIWIKLIKLLLVTINYLLFLVVRIVIIVTVTVIIFLGELVDYFSGFLMMLGFLALFVLSGDVTPDYIPFIPANVEMLLFFVFLAILVEMVKIMIIKSSVNIYAFIRNIEDKIFVKILMK